MRVIVVGAGPVGCVTAIGLARQGHEVTVVDRDPGPAADGTWARKGVMQFRHPHGFRPNINGVLSHLMPDVWDALVAAGCLAVTPPGAPPFVRSLCARRSTFERGMRAALRAEPGVTEVLGRVDSLVADGDHLVGVALAGTTIGAECVVVATGRSGHLGEDYRAPAEEVAAGMSYVSRMYRALPGVDTPVSAIPSGVEGPGYLSIVFHQDDRTLSTLIVRADDDDALGHLRDDDVFDRVAPAIPNLAPWVDPERYEPITEAMAGGGLVNHYQSVLDVDGACHVPGLLFVGDTVLSTNPQAGRGVSTGLEQARALLGLIEEHDDLAAVAQDFDAWCLRSLRPWFDDHVRWDAALTRVWRGEDVDLEGSVPSHVVCAAAAVDPAIAPAAATYSAMLATPDVLDPFREQTRELLRTGWRPPAPTGPTRDELAALIAQPASVPA